MIPAEPVRRKASADLRAGSAASVSLAPPAVALVGEPDDLLLAEIAARLASRGVAHRRLDRAGLAGHTITVDDTRVRVDGIALRALFWRCDPGAALADDFVPADRGFVDAEVRATWLAAMHLPSITVVNRYDAGAWFEGAAWPVWRRRLRDAGSDRVVALAPFTFGCASEDGGAARWLPYGGGGLRPSPGPRAARLLAAGLTDDGGHDAQAAIFACGHCVEGTPVEASVAAAAVLAASGIALASVLTNRRGEVLSVDTNPGFVTAAGLAAAADRLARLLGSDGAAP